MRYVIYGIFLFLFSCAKRVNLEEISAFDDISYDQFKTVIHDLQTRGRRDDKSDHWFWKMPETQMIYSKTEFLLPLHRRFWRDHSVSAAEKGLSIRLSQCLAKNDRLKLIADVFSDYKNGIISEKVVITILSPGSDWSSWLDLNYRDKEVRETLAKILNDPLATELIIETITTTLDGTGFEFLKEYGSDVAQKLKCDKY